MPEKPDKKSSPSPSTEKGDRLKTEVQALEAMLKEKKKKKKKEKNPKSKKKKQEKDNDDDHAS